MTKDIVEDYMIIFFVIVLGIIISSTIKTILSYTFTILKVLYNIIIIIK